MESFTEHIEGNIDPVTRTAGRKDRDLIIAPPVAAASAIEEEEEPEQVRPKTTESEMSSKFRYDPVKEAKKFNIPEECMLQFLKMNRILTLSDDYLLVQHPFP